MISIRPLLAGIAAIALGLAADAAAAQSAKPAADARPADRADQLLSADVETQTPAPVSDGEAYRRAGDAEQDPAELRTTRALNDEIVSRNQLAENQDQADRARYEDTVTASTQAQLAYEEEVRRSQAAQSDWNAEQARWQADRARWEADIRACDAGDRTHCSTRVR